MNTTETWIQKADDALRRAAKRAREVAAQTNTPLLVRRDGKLVQITMVVATMPVAEDLAVREEAPSYAERKP